MLCAIEIIALGKLKHAHADLVDFYQKQMSSPFTIIEIDDRNQTQSQKKLEKYLTENHYKICLDETGQSYTSRAFSKKLQNIALSGASKIQFFIGGADGHPDFLKKKADLLLSFGQQTWPHQLVRIMLVEQIYRAQQILAGHPYHRD